MLDVRDVPERSRYEGYLDDQLVAILDYSDNGDEVLLTYAEVTPALRGGTLGSELVEQSLADLRAKDRRVVPICGYVARWMATHPETADLRAG